jgi:predicted TIM-barrel fold metal-dependent hydrolase
VIVDSHAHVGHGRFKSLSPADLLRHMDENDVDRALLCPVEEQIVAFNHEGNLLILAQARRHPKRFVGFAVANPWFGEIAVRELEWAFKEGLRGLKLHPVLQGFPMNDALVYPLIDVAARHGAPVYVHCGSAHFGEPLRLVELARRYPEVTFLMGHSSFSDFSNDLPRCHQFAPNILFETSRNTPGNLHEIGREIGTDYMVFGSNAPEHYYNVDIPVLLEVFPDPADQEKIFSHNIARALGESE